jgi:thymidine phosphorylase
MITSSILSKKLSAGLDYLVMDVKVGSGAFMPSYEKSLELANSIVSVGTGAGLPTAALLTDMNESLAPSAGNALEVRLALDYLSGRARPARLHEVTMALCAEMLLLGGLATSLDHARQRLQATLDSGAAAERFARMVSALGGPADLLERPDAYLEAAPVLLPVAAPRSGYVQLCDCRSLGLTVLGLGGGRSGPTDSIDFAVGLSELVQIGNHLEAGQPLAIIHARTEAAAQQAVRELQLAYQIGDTSPVPGTAIYSRIGSGKRSGNC